MLPSGKLTKNYGTSPFSMGKSTISMAIFNSYVKLPDLTQIAATGSYQSSAGFTSEVSPKASAA